MKNLKQIIQEAELRKVAVGHFNIAEFVALKGIFESARELNLPIIIGTSEGEAKFLGRRQAASLVRSLREQYDYPIFINSDHTHSLEEAKDAVEAGYDAILFDAGEFSIEENIKKTKEAVEFIKSANPEILVEAELGYIGSSSQIHKALPEGVLIDAESLTSSEQAEEFVKVTGVDLLAPSVGNIHGIIAGLGNPALDIERIKAIRKAAGIPLVLHGGSGIKDNDFLAAIDAGISIIHINTEIRIAWRRGLEIGLKNNPEEIAPYKILLEAVNEVKTVIKARLQLFNKMV